MRCYYGLHQKEQIKRSETRPSTGAFCGRHEGPLRGLLVGVNRNTSAYYFHRLREIIAYYLEQEADMVFGGEIEMDESYFGGKREGKRGRGAGAIVPVFGLLTPRGRSARRSFQMPH